MHCKCAIDTAVAVLVLGVLFFLRKQRLLKRATDESRVHVKCKPDLASLELTSDVRTYDFKRVSPAFDKAVKDRN